MINSVPYHWKRHRLRKTEKTNWLQRQRIPCTADLRKSELLKIHVTFPLWKVDDIARPSAHPFNRISTYTVLYSRYKRYVSASHKPIYSCCNNKSWLSLWEKYSKSVSSDYDFPAVQEAANRNPFSQDLGVVPLLDSSCVRRRSKFNERASTPALEVRSTFHYKTK
jgi:hypothetical protein